MITGRTNCDLNSHAFSLGKGTSVEPFASAYPKRYKVTVSPNDVGEYIPWSPTSVGGIGLDQVAKPAEVSARPRKMLADGEADASTRSYSYSSTFNTSRDVDPTGKKNFQSDIWLVPITKPPIVSAGLIAAIKAARGNDVEIGIPQRVVSRIDGVTELAAVDGKTALASTSPDFPPFAIGGTSTPLDPSMEYALLEWREVFYMSQVASRLFDPTHWQYSGWVSPNVESFRRGAITTNKVFALGNGVSVEPFTSPFPKRYKVTVSANAAGAFVPWAHSWVSGVSLTQVARPTVVSAHPRKMLAVSESGDNARSYYYSSASNTFRDIDPTGKTNFQSEIWVVPISKSVVPQPPSIAVQPQSQTALIGGTVTFSATLSAPGSFDYQWRLNGVNIQRATNNSLTLINVQATNSGSYSVAVANAAGAVNSDIAQLTVQIPSNQPGDNFAERVPLSGPSGAVTGTNSLATREASEPRHGNKPGGKSVWFTWRAAANGIAKISTAGSSFDTVLAVYTGTSLVSLVAVRSDDDSAGFLTSQVAFNAISGTDYQIAIDGFAGASGQVVLTWDLQVTSEALPVPTTSPQGQTVGQGSSTTFTASAPGPGVAYQWFFNGSLIPDATNSTFTVANVQPSTVGSYYVRLTSGNQSVNSPVANLEINLTDGAVQPVATTDKFADSASAASNPVALQVLAQRFVGKASVAHGFTGTQIFNTYGSTKEPGEPNHCGVIGGASRWFAYRAETGGTLTVDTDGSEFDTVLAIYTNTGLDYSTLVFVACDNNSGMNGKTSRVNLAATGGSVYYVAVDGVNGATGVVQLNYHLSLVLFLRSARFLGSFGFQVLSPSGKTFTIQSSGDLTNWTPILTNSLSSSVFDFVAPNSNAPWQFYRAIAP